MLFGEKNANEKSGFMSTFDHELYKIRLNETYSVDYVIDESN